MQTTPGTVTLKAPIHDYTLPEVACLLRLVYHPSDASKEGFTAILPHLRGVLRLAHQLEIEALVDGTTDFVTSIIDSGDSDALSLEQLAEWASLAERLHLDALRAHSVRAMTVRLLQPASHWRAPFAAIASIAPSCSPTCMAMLFGTLLTACRYNFPSVARNVPAASTLARWQLEPRTQPPLPLIWEVPGASAQLQGTKIIFRTKSFTRGGREWHVLVQPEELVGFHLYLEAGDVEGGATAAYCCLTICNQVRTGRTRRVGQPAPWPDATTRHACEHAAGEHASQAVPHRRRARAVQHP